MGSEKRTIVKDIVNNIIYVEPNYTHSDIEQYGVNGLNTYEFTPPLEDYSIFVNLEVEVRGRNIQTSKTANNRKLIMSYVSTTDGKSNVNFMQGSKIPIGDGKTTINSLTTNYTDLFLGDLKKNGPSTEMFGIQSIDISYNNYMVPEVTIEFVDVRGVSLFAQKEYYETNKNIDKAISSDNQEDIANTFFQCFFTFPYPKFTILVKGFYGQPVSYELTCADFRARFDSRTGNFGCTAKFVGYYFSFLNDVMINGLIAAPYSDYIGASYWASKAFMLEGKSGNNFPIPKFGELLRNMKDIQATAEKTAQSDPLAQEMISHETQKQKFTSLKDAYSKFTSYINEFVKEREYQKVKIFFTSNNSQGDIKGMIYLTDELHQSNSFSTLIGDGNGALKGSYDGLIKLIDEYNNEFPSHVLPKPSRIDDIKPTQLIATKENSETEAYTIGDAIVGINDGGHHNHGMFKNLVNSVYYANKKPVKNPYLDKKYGYYYDDNGFSAAIDKFTQKIDEKIKEASDGLQKVKDDSIANAIGFYPTVENMTKIVMAHFETFARMIFETAKNICDENPSRTIQSLNVGSVRNITDISSKETIVPPFPRVAEEKRRGGVTNLEDSWVGDYSGEFKEKDLVHGILNGVNEVAKEIINYEKASGASGSQGAGYGGGSNTPTKSTMKYPLSPLDIIADKKIYGDNAFDQNETSSLLGIVALRAIQVLGINHFKEWGKRADILGKLEAKNLLSERKLSKETLKKLSDVKPDEVISMMKGVETSTIKKPGNGSQPWPWWTDANIIAGMIDNGGDLVICRVQYGAFSVPYQNLSWSKINNETINSQYGSKAMWSNDYLNTKGTANCTKDNIFTFDTNINRFSSIIENQLNDETIENLSITYRDTFLKECKYDPDKYKNIINEGEDVIAYIIENAASMVPTDKSCMLPTSKNYYANKKFGGGYNMNYFNGENPGDGGENWQDKDGNDVKRRGSDGYNHYLQEFNSRDFTFTEFPGLEQNLDIYIKTFDGSLGKHPATSVFAQGLYYRQDDIRARALMFLASLGYAFKYEKIIKEYICNEAITMCVLPLPSIMFIGALLWADTTEGKKKLKGGLNTGHYKDSLASLAYLRSDVQRRFIAIFEKWVNSGVEGNSLLRSFSDIKSGMEIEFLKRKPEEFFNIMPEVEDKHALGWKTAFDAFEGCGYESISDILVNEFGDNFFRNYIAIDEDIYGNSELGTRGLRLGNRDGGPSAVHACNFALAGCCFSKNSKYFMGDSGTSVKVDVGEVTKFFEGFLNIIKEEKYDEEVKNTSVSQAIDPKDSTKDIKIGVYRYCKMIYDKWIAGLSEKDFEERWTMQKFFEGNDKYFHFIDAFYNNKSDIKLNIGDFCDEIISCYRDEQYSLLSFLSSVYAKNKLNFICVQNFLDLGKKENMETMFDAIPYTSVWEVKRNPNFIVMYPYETSNYLDVENSEYENDGFMINMPPSTRNKWPEPLTSRNANSNIGYNIPAFGVSYGKMYQSYFKDIDISMDNPTVTEQSIKAQFAIACQNNEGEQSGDRSQIYTYGQDLYSIYSNNSYTCNITMMGCAWIQPLMYFVLNNIPMFRGTYLIEKVWHHIEPGNMTTKFMGVRMSNVCIRIAEDDNVRAKNNQDGSGSNSDMVTIQEKLASVDNDCPYKAYPLEDEVDNLNLSGEIIADASKIMKAIMARGYTKAQAAGIVGNMMIESKLNPKNVICDSNKQMAGGLCMWNAHSLNALLHNDPVHVDSDKQSGGYDKMPCDSYNANDIKQKMPSAETQIKFLLDSLEQSSFLVETMKVKQNLLAQDTPEKAAFVFASKFERCGDCSDPNSKSVKERKKYAKKFYDEYKDSFNAQIEKNTDKHISKLANGFLNAINRTAASSSENVKIGVISEKSKGDTILLNNPEKSNRFSAVLDMILSAYSNKVESVYWVLPGDGQNQLNAVPLYYLVTVKEGASVTKVYISSEKAINTPFAASSVHVPVDDKVGIHQDFCKALVKKYHNDVEKMKNDTNSVLDNYDALIKKFTIETCENAMQAAGVNTSGSGTENEQGYIGDWNVGKFVQRLHYWKDNICEIFNEKRSTKPGYDGCGKCTGVINRALKDSGLGDKYWGSYPWDVYDKMKKGNSDFVEIASSTNAQSNVEFSFGTEIKRGDICVMWKTRNENDRFFHTCAFDGSNWYSDYKQYSCNGYKSRKPPVTMQWHLFRHKS